MAFRAVSSLRPALGLGLVLTIAAVAPLACFFPSNYVFDLSTGGSSSSGHPSTSTSSSTGSSGLTSTSSSTSTSTSSSTSGMGGSGGASSSSTGSTTTSSTTSSSGVPCASQDCSDPTCKNSFACVPAATMLPSGWTGYFALYDGAPANVPGCAGTWPTQGYLGNGDLTAPPATCPCTCGTPAGGTCQIPELDISDGACTGGGTCSGPVVPPTGYVPGTCFGFMNSSSSGYVYYGGSTCGPQTATNCSMGTQPCNVSGSVGSASVNGDSCAPSAPNPMKPKYTWGSAGQACGGATPGTGCTGTEVCMPIPGGSFHSGVCIMQTGNQTCPAGQFTEQHVFYDSQPNDTRGCSACSCGSPTGSTCTVQWKLFEDAANPNCSTLKLTADSTTTTCAALSGNPNITSAKATITLPPNGGMCAPVDGSPTGTVTPATPTTFCCVP